MKNNICLYLNRISCLEIRIKYSNPAVTPENVKFAQVKIFQRGFNFLLEDEPSGIHFFITTTMTAIPLKKEILPKFINFIEE